MKLEEVRIIAVIGAGNMGNQIAEILSRLGVYEVNIQDINEQFVSKGLQAIEERLEKFFVAKGKITPDEKKRIMGRIKGTTSAETAAKDADLIIEAATENLTLKKEIFKKLDESAPAHSILASNTSYQNISEMGSVTKRPDKVVGIHFFNPPSVMQLVEIVRGGRTSDDVVELTCGLARKLGKEPVVCRDTSYGFLANRAYAVLQIECFDMLMEKVAPPESIDKALKLGYNLPVGPIELGDRIGAWNLWATSEQDKMREVGPEKGRLHPLVRMMLRAGYTKVYEYWDKVMSKW